MKSYEEMLDELYSKLPKKRVTSERFQPPSFSSFVQGNKTIISNFVQVAETLRRDAQDILKYLSKELAAPGNVDAKRALFSSKFNEKQLNARLDSYINEYVLCNECHRPDTDLIMFEGHRYKQCQGCGARSPVKSI